MSMPGFTSETSLYKSSRLYWTGWRSSSLKANIQPQQQAGPGYQECAQQCFNIANRDAAYCNALRVADIYGLGAATFQVCESARVQDFERCIDICSAWSGSMGAGPPAGGGKPGRFQVYMDGFCIAGCD